MSHTSFLMAIDQRLEESEGDCHAAMESVPLNESPLNLPVRQNYCSITLYLDSPPRMPNDNLF